MYNTEIIFKIENDSSTYTKKLRIVNKNKYIK